MKIRLVEFSDGKFGVQFQMFLFFWGTFKYSIGSREKANQFYEEQIQDNTSGVVKRIVRP